MYELLQRSHDDTRSNKKYDKFDEHQSNYWSLFRCCQVMKFGYAEYGQSEAQTLKAILYILILSGVLQLHVVVSLVLCGYPLNRRCPN
jgi:hypothetical protein